MMKNKAQLDAEVDMILYSKGFPPEEPPIYLSDYWVERLKCRAEIFENWNKMYISKENGKHVLYIRGRFVSRHDSYSEARAAYDTWLTNHT